MKEYQRYIVEPCRLIKGTIGIYAHGIYDNITETFVEEYNRKGFSRKFLEDEVKRLNWDFNVYNKSITEYCKVLNETRNQI